MRLTALAKKFEQKYIIAKNNEFINFIDKLEVDINKVKEYDNKGALNYLVRVKSFLEEIPQIVSENKVEIRTDPNFGVKFYINNDCTDFRSIHDFDYGISDYKSKHEHFLVQVGNTIFTSFYNKISDDIKYLDFKYDSLILDTMNPELKAIINKYLPPSILHIIKIYVEDKYKDYLNHLFFEFRDNNIIK